MSAGVPQQPHPAPPPPSRVGGGHLSAPPPPRSHHRTPSPASAAASARRSGPPPGSAAASSSSAPPPPQQRRQQQRSHGHASTHSSRGDSPTLGSSDTRLPPLPQQRPQLSPRQYSNSTARSSSWRARSQASRSAPTSALPPLPTTAPITDAGARRSPSDSPDLQFSASPESTLSPNNFLDLFPSPDVHARDTSPRTSAALVAAALALRKAQETPSRPGAPSQDRPMLCSEAAPMPPPLGRPLDLTTGQRKRLPIVPLPAVTVPAHVASTADGERSSSPLEYRTAPLSGPSSAPSLHDHVAAGLSYTLAAAQLITPEPTRVDAMLSQEAINVLNSTPMPVLLARALAKINDLELALEYYRDTAVRASADAVFWESQYQRLVRDFLKLEAESRASVPRQTPNWHSHDAPAQENWQPRRSSATAHAQPSRRESRWGTAAETSQHRAARTDSHPRDWRNGEAPLSEGPSDVATGLHAQPLAPLHRRGAWRRGSAETARQHQRSSSESYEAIGPSAVPAAVRMAHLAARRPSSSSTPRRRSETTPLAQEIVSQPREVPTRRRSPALEWMRSSSVSECGESAPPEEQGLPASSDDQIYHEMHSDADTPLSAPATEAWRAIAPAPRGPSDVPVDETSDHLSSPGAQRGSGDCITSIDGLERLAVSGSVMTANLGARHVSPEARTRASHAPTTGGPQYLLQSRRPFSFTPNASPTQALRSLGSPFVHYDSPVSAGTHGPLTPLDGVSPFISPRTSVDTSPSLPADPFAWRPLSGLALSFGEAHDVHAQPLQSYWSESTCPSTEESEDGALEAWRRGCLAEPGSASSSLRNPSSSSAASFDSAAPFDYARDAPGTLQHNPRASKGGTDALFFGSSPSPKQRPASLPHQMQQEPVHES